MNVDREWQLHTLFLRMLQSCAPSGPFGHNGPVVFCPILTLLRTLRLCAGTYSPLIGYEFVDRGFEHRRVDVICLLPLEDTYSVI